MNGEELIAYDITFSSIYWVKHISNGDGAALPANTSLLCLERSVDAKQKSRNIPSDDAVKHHTDPSLSGRPGGSHPSLFETNGPLYQRLSTARPKRRKECLGTTCHRLSIKCSRSFTIKKRSILTAFTKDNKYLLASTPPACPYSAVNPIHLNYKASRDLPTKANAPNRVLGALPPALLQ